METSIVLDLWVHTAVLFLALAVDVVGLVQKTHESLATQVALIVAQGLLAVYRLDRFMKQPAPESFDELSRTQSRLVATLDFVSLGVFVAVDVTSIGGGHRNIVVFLSALGGLLHFRVSQVSAEARMRITFRGHPGPLSHEQSRLHCSLVVLRVAGLVSTFLWSAVGIVSVMDDRPLLVTSVLFFGASIVVYGASTRVYQLYASDAEPKTVRATIRLARTMLPSMFL